MSNTPLFGQIWPQGIPLYKSPNNFFRVLPPGSYSLTGIAAAFETDAIPEDPYIDNVVLLLNMEGEIGSNLFVDRALRHTVTPVNGATISGTQKKFGVGSYSNNNQNRYLEVSGSTDFSFPGDFTIEVWIWGETTQSSYPTVFEFGNYTNGILFRPWHGGGGLWVNSNNLGDFQNETLLPRQQWNHVAFTRAGSTFRCFINGQLDKTATISGTLNTTNGLIRIGSSTHTTGQHLNGYIDEVRVTKGVARYVEAFTVPGLPFPLVTPPPPPPPDESVDQYFGNVSLLFSFDGLSGSTVALDDGPANVTATISGGAQISPAETKFGTGSLRVANSGQTVVFDTSNPAVTLDADFTIEAWIYPLDGADQILFGNTSQNVQIFRLNFSGAGSIFYYSSTGSFNSSAGVIQQNQWSHVALVREGTAHRYYVNGVQVASSTFSVLSIVFTQISNIYGTPVNCYIDELRVTKGIARYTTSLFNAPTERFPRQRPAATDPNFSNVSLLLPFDGADGSTTFTDRSLAARTATRFGNTQISQAQIKFGTASALFDGSLDYITFDPSPDLEFNSDFTIECWVRTASASDMVVASSTVDSNTQIFRINQTGGSGTLACYLNEVQVFNPVAAGITIGTWHHLAISRNSNLTRMFVDGVQVGNTNSSWTGIFRLNVIGTMFLGGVRYAYDFNGHIDDFRVTKGVARYITNFTPPIEPFPTEGSPPEPTPEPTPEIIVSQITYSQSSIYGGTTPVSNSIMTNGSFTDTGVATNSSALEWVAMDLGSVKSVGQVVIGTATNSIPGGWSKFYTENRNVRYSIDGTTWTTAFNTGTFAVNGIYTFNVDFEARYIRIEHNGWLAISEFYALSPEPTPEPAPTDPDFSSVSLLLPFTGENNSTVFTDFSSNNLTVTRHGDTKISSSESKFGGTSGAFDGTGDYLSLAPSSLFNFANNTPFTVELFVYSSGNQTANIISQRDASIVCPFELAISNTGTNGIISWHIGNSALNGWQTVSGITAGMSDLAWHHIALVGDGTDIKIYVNGTSVFTTTQPAWAAGTNPLFIGRGAGSPNFNGYIDEVRVTKGVARYIANFTPPTAAFPTAPEPPPTDPNFSSVSLLLPFDGANGSTTFTDESNNAFTVTVFGNTQFSTAQSKWGGASGLFDGNGDYLKLAPAPALQFDGDFTIECWSWLASSAQMVIGSSASDPNTQVFRVNDNGAGRLGCFLNGTWVFQEITAGITTNTWQHLAVCRSGGSTRLFVDGVQQGTTNTSWTGTFRMDVIGAFFFNGVLFSQPNFVNGHIDDLRITKGIARYTANFSPPDAPFPTS
jgi:hypothetical protein